MLNIERRQTEKQRHTMARVSILIPVYNDVCTRLVSCISKIADATQGLVYEILVAEDGSDDVEKTGKNSQVAAMAHCRYIKRDNNVGRAAIRNFLAKEAQFEWLLFLDCDVDIDNCAFFSNYIEAAATHKVVYGGLSIGGDSEKLRSNLRYIYEKRSEPRQTAAIRNGHPYQSFRTTNFFIARAVMLAHPFNEHIRTYGYEDVMFGKAMQESRIPIFHIDNQVHYMHYEDNLRYLSKTEEAMRTLYDFRNDLADFSSLIALQGKLHSCRIDLLFDVMFRFMHKRWREKLISPHPSVGIYNAYRFCLFNHLCRHHGSAKFH